MADLEVENTLREIRERVLADAQRRTPASNGATTATAATNGVETVNANGHAGSASEALARMDANLATTARAWSRLPPLLSYRRGAAARFEIWVKRLVKRAVHWFTWEQVNFNAAVNHALGDARTALARTREEMLGEVQALRAEAEADRARVAEALARFESGGAQLRQAFAAGLERLAESQHATTNALREELSEVQRAELRARAAELHAEMRERMDGLLEEQRVCFKQLSLEAGEAAVMHDRARRQLEARLETLEGKDEGKDGGR